MTNSLNQGDDITFVELASILYRRRYTVLTVFVLITILGLIFAILKSEKYQYVSLVQLAELGQEEFLEQPDTAIATLDSFWLPQAAALYESSEGAELPFSVAFSNPEGTGLVRLSTEASPRYSDEIRQIHSELIDKLREKQGDLVEREKKRLQARLASIVNNIESLKLLTESQDVGSALADAYQQKAKLETAIESINKPEIVALSNRGAEEKGISRFAVVLLALLAGLVLGTLSAFFAEFTQQVRKNLQNG